MGGVGLQMTIDGGKSFATDAARQIHDDVHAIWIDPANSRSPDDRRRRRRGHFVGHEQDLDVAAQPAGRPLLPRGLRLRVAVQRVRRHAGQLRLVRAEPGRASAPASPTTSGRRSRAATASSPSSTRATRASCTPSRRTATSSATTVTGEARSIRPTQQNVTNAKPDDGNYRFNWDTPLMFSPNDPGVLYAAANHVFTSTDRGDSWIGDQPGPDDQRGSRRDRDDGRQGQRHPHLARRRHLGVADHRLARRVRQAARRPATPARTTAS